MVPGIRVVATEDVAERRSAYWRLLAAVSLALVGGLWIGAVVWAEGRADAVVVDVETGWAALRPLILGAVLLVALAGHAVFFWRVEGGSSLMAPLIVAVVWAGVVAESQVTPTDAVGLVIMVGVWLAALHKLPVAAPVGVATGLALVLSPFLVGSIVGLVPVLRGGNRARAWWFSLAGWFVAGLAAGLVIGIAAGRPVWASFAGSALVYELGPAAVWRYLAELLDLAAPLLVVGGLGAVVAAGRCDPGGAGRGRGGEAEVHRGLGIWLLVNAVLACSGPKLCAGHLLVMIAPAALLAASGWSALRRLVARGAPLIDALPGGVCLFLLAVLLWVPAAAAGRMLLIALLPP